MPRFHNIGGKKVQFTAEEETLRDAEEKAWADAAPTRRMNRLREQRDLLLAETDWTQNRDVTLTNDADWKTYRQALRDITTQTPTDDALSNIKFPEKPKG